MWDLIWNWQGNTFKKKFFFYKTCKLIALGVSIWRAAFKKPQVHIWVTISCPEQEHQHRHAHACATSSRSLAVRMWNVIFFLLLDKHLVHVTVQALIRDFHPVYFLSQTEANKTHSPFSSSIPTNYMAVLYTYMTYFIKINFNNGIRHHYLISLNVI